MPARYTPTAELALRYAAAPRAYATLLQLVHACICALPTYADDARRIFFFFFFRAFLPRLIAPRAILMTIRAAPTRRAFTTHCGADGAMLLLRLHCCLRRGLKTKSAAIMSCRAFIQTLMLPR